MTYYNCQKCTDIGIQFGTTSEESYTTHLKLHEGREEEDKDLKLIVHAVLGDQVFKG